MNEEIKSKISWKLIHMYFQDNPNALVQHHLDSCNDFYAQGIPRIFRENNPIRFVAREEDNENENETNECSLYLGGKLGDKIYYGKPVIYDDNHVHYMFPNDARLRNMTYGVTIHYDVDVDFIYYVEGVKKEHSIVLPNIYLGMFPIMLQSKLCILHSLDRNVRYTMGECRNDYGGYFIIDGKEKVIVSQEKFADNLLYIRENKDDDEFSHSAEIRSVSEDSSKPTRKTSVHIVAPSSLWSNQQIVVSVPNVKKPVPLFILMRALGVITDKDIIQTCLLEDVHNNEYTDMFIPSVHDAGQIFNQQNAIEFIAELTKRRTTSSVLEILADYFLPHIGETNFLDKALFLGYMVMRLLKVSAKEEKPTDRDNFSFKRIELSGNLMYDLFREYYLIQKGEIARKIDEEYYYHKGEYVGVGETSAKTKKKRVEEEQSSGNKYKSNFVALIETNFRSFFKGKTLESGFRKAFKGNWGGSKNTKRIGIVQDLNRLSWYTFISHLRKINLPLSSNAKVVGPRLLNSSQWGYIDPIDTPDGGNIGLHKHLSIMAHITSNVSGNSVEHWLHQYTSIRSLQECSLLELGANTKLLLNGKWVGVTEDPISLTHRLKTLRRNGVLPVYTSISFHHAHNELRIFTDAGRLTRPIYCVTKQKASFEKKQIYKQLTQGEDLSWEKIIAGFLEKTDAQFHTHNQQIYKVASLYKDADASDEQMEAMSSVVDYIDPMEEETAYIANQLDELAKNKWYTHLELDASLLLGVMGNLIIYPENNPITRSSFSCGQSKQAVSVYHSNYQMRMDKMGVILNYGQTPLIKSRYLEYINKEEQPYGVNAIVAIMCYTGYNVEDAILINDASVKRGIFRTTYFTSYEAREESAKVTGSSISKFANIQKNNVIGIKEGYDYSYLDDAGLIRENTEINEKIILIGKINSSLENKDVWIDDSVKTKKGQLGYVDKSFITLGEEGFNVAKVRIREERMPAIGDKMASRAGQKGTIGLIIPEADMPFTEDGIRPDLIINPHAIPSRMTIGQIVESLFGKLCASYGAFGDCTAFQVKGSNYSTYAPMLVDAGFHSSGNQVLYNGMTGEQLASDIYIGPTYYMRLKHMVKDKINYRARGPNNVLTRQPVQGRANDGGLRIGEMERDGLLAHGMSYFLNESFMTRGEKPGYYIAVCNKTGMLSIYNPSRNLFMSPYADGPLHFHVNVDNSQSIMKMTRFGRSFSLIQIPYSFKLLMQELQTMNVQMRIITEDNIDQLMSMSFSNNIQKLMKTNENLKDIIQKVNKDMYKNNDNRPSIGVPSPVVAVSRPLPQQPPVPMPIQQPPQPPIIQPLPIQQPPQPPVPIQQQMQPQPIQPPAPIGGDGHANTDNSISLESTTFDSLPLENPFAPNILSVSSETPVEVAAVGGDDTSQPEPPSASVEPSSGNGEKVKVVKIE